MSHVDVTGKKKKLQATCNMCVNPIWWKERRICTRWDMGKRLPDKKKAVRSSIAMHLCACVLAGLIKDERTRGQLVKRSRTECLASSQWEGLFWNNKVDAIGCDFFFSFDWNAIFFFFAVLYRTTIVRDAEMRSHEWNELIKKWKEWHWLCRHCHGNECDRC